MTDRGIRANYVRAEQHQCGVIRDETKNAKTYQACCPRGPDVPL
jgi:hypothetical protein